jgi:hypothetical protein
MFASGSGSTKRIGSVCIAKGIIAFRKCREGSIADIIRNESAANSEVYRYTQFGEAHQMVICIGFSALGFHSSVSFCASATCAGIMLFTSASLSVGVEGGRWLAGSASGIAGVRPDGGS